MIMCLERDKIMRVINGIVNYAEPLICLVNRHPIICVDWKPNLANNHICGESCNPCNVYIYPLNLFKLCNQFNWNESDYYIKLCEVVVHELYHINQYIDFYRVGTDKEYLDEIESQVDACVYYFMHTHINDIIEIITINTNMNIDNTMEEFDIDYFNNYLNGNYNIRYFGNHIKSLLTELGVEEEDVNIVLNSIIVSQKYYIEINGDIIPIKNNGVYYSIDDINECARSIFNYKYNYPETSIYRIYDDCIIITNDIIYDEEDKMNEDQMCYTWNGNGYSIM